MVIITTEEAARKLPELKKRVLEESRKWNREDAILGLLCLEDAYDNLANAIASDVRLESEVQRAVLVRHLSQRFLLIESGLSLILHNGGDGVRTLDRFPDVEVSVGHEDFESLVRHLISEGKLTPLDAFFAGPLRLAGEFTTGYVIRVRNARGTAREAVIGEILDFLDRITACNLYENAVHLGLTLMLQDSQIVPRVNYPPSVTAEKVMAIERTGPRTILQSSLTAPEWSSEYMKTMAQTVRTVNLGLDSYANRASMERERSQFIMGYEQFPGYTDLFERELGFSVRCFDMVTHALSTMARPMTHTVCVAPLKRIMKTIEKKTNLRPSSVRPVLEALMWRTGLPPRHFPIIPLRASHVFSLHRIMYAIGSRLEGCFQSAYDNDMKGRVFERSCREMLSREGFSVHPDRIGVDKQVLSNEDSLEIWGRVKIGTDFDVLGSKGWYLLVLECKERKRNVSRLTRLSHLFLKCSRELQLKSEWLSKNMDCLAGSPCLSGAAPSPEYLVPIIVCNFVIDEGGRIPNLQTLREFSYFLQKFDFTVRPTRTSLEVPLSPAVSQEVGLIPIQPYAQPFPA